MIYGLSERWSIGADLCRKHPVEVGPLLCRKWQYEGWRSVVTAQNNVKAGIYWVYLLLSEGQKWHQGWMTSDGTSDHVMKGAWHACGFPCIQWFNDAKIMQLLNTQWSYVHTRTQTHTYESHSCAARVLAASQQIVKCIKFILFKGATCDRLRDWRASPCAGLVVSACAAFLWLDQHFDHVIAACEFPFLTVRL